MNYGFRTTGLLDFVHCHVFKKRTQETRSLLILGSTSSIRTVALLFYGDSTERRS